MKFLLDMGISPKVVAALRRLGHEASHLSELGLQRASDAQILDKARAEGAVLLTHDLDFGDLLAASEETLPSVVIFRLRSMRPETVVPYLSGVISEHSETLRKGSVLVVVDGGIRQRFLPIVRD